MAESKSKVEKAAAAAQSPTEDTAKTTSDSPAGQTDPRTEGSTEKPAEERAQGDRNQEATQDGGTNPPAGVHGELGNGVERVGEVSEHAAPPKVTGSEEWAATHGHDPNDRERWGGDY